MLPGAIRGRVLGSSYRTHKWTSPFVPPAASRVTGATSPEEAPPELQIGDARNDVFVEGPAVDPFETSQEKVLR